MKPKKFTYSIFGILLLIILGSIFSCSLSDKKIPLTTNSQKAKELYLKGLNLYERLRTYDAAEYFEKAVSVDTGFALAYLKLAETRKTPSAFYKYFEIASRLKATASKGEQLLIEASEAQINNQTARQKEILEELVSLYPKDERANFYLATSYYGIHDYSKAIEIFKTVLDINPEYSPVYNLMGYAYRNMKNYTAAEEMFQKYIELIPNDPNPYDSYGELLLEMGKFDQSIENYEKALKIDPYFYFSYSGIASNLNYKEEHVKARNMLNELLQTKRDIYQYRIAHNGIALSYFDEGNTKAGLKHFLMLLENSITNNDTAQMITDYFIAGVAFREAGVIEKAEELIDSALHLSESSSITGQRKTNNRFNHLINSAQLDIKRNNLEAAKDKNEQYRNFAKEKGNDNMLRFTYQVDGMIALEEADYQSAIDNLLKANQENPYNLYRLGLAYEAIGDMERAKSFYTKSAKSYSLANLNYAMIRKKAQQKAEMLE